MPQRYRARHTMQDLRAIATAELTLRAVAPSDLEGLFTIMHDPEQWRHAPQSRHLDRATTAAWIERAVRRWREHGLSYWVASVPDDPARIIGVGGAQRQSTRAWNLYWRISTSHQRRGLATRLGEQALDAAASRDPTVPAIAWIRDTNAASVAVANKLGLEPQGPHLDPSDATERLAFSDRALSPRYFAQP